VITIFFLNVIIIYIVIEYIIYYSVYSFRTFSGFESTTVRVIRKYNFKEDDCVLAYTISLQVFGK